METFVKAFEKADEVRDFRLGRFEIVHLPGVSLGRATYQPGWKWSVHNAPSVGTPLCHAVTRANGRASCNSASGLLTTVAVLLSGYTATFTATQQYLGSTAHGQTQLL